MATGWSSWTYTNRLRSNVTVHQTVLRVKQCCCDSRFLGPKTGGSTLDIMLLVKIFQVVQCGSRESHVIVQLVDISWCVLPFCASTMHKNMNYCVNSIYIESCIRGKD